MTTEQKSILIDAIINFLRENIKIKNRKLAHENLHSEQEKFDSTGLFITLAFMPDDQIKKISGLILGG